MPPGVLYISATSMRFRGGKLATIRLGRAVSELRWRLDKVGCPILLDRVGLSLPKFCERRSHRELTRMCSSGER